MLLLSTRRRHPLAGLLVVLLGLMLAGGVYSALAPASAEDAAKSDQTLIEEGRRLYVVGCSSCHGLNAEGILTKSDTNYGPSLIGVGAASVDFQVGTGRMPLAQPGPQAAVKEVIYTDEEIEQLAAYIASLSPGPAIPSEEDATVGDPTEEQLRTGFAFFLTNCTACHNFAAAGGALPNGGYAPALLETSNKHVLEAMLTGPGQMPVFSDEVLSIEEKQTILAYLNRIEEQPAYGGSALGSKGPVIEGLWGWLGGIGSLVLASVWIGNNGVRAGKKRS